MHAIAEVLFDWLVDFMAFSTVVLVLVVAARSRIQQPVRRLALARSTFVGLLLLAILCAAPGWSRVHLARNDFQDSVQASDRLAEVDGDSTPDPRGAAATTLVSNVDGAATSRVTESVDFVSNIGPTSSAWKLWIVVAYIAGGALVALWQAVGTALVRRVISRASPGTAQLRRLWEDVAGTHSETMELLVTAEVQTPVAVGIRRSKILIPQAMVEKHDLAQVRLMLSHEWAHVRRGDLKALALTRALLLILWPHPLFLLLRRQSQHDQELLADALAAEATDRTEYAGVLLDLARRVAKPRRWIVGASVGWWVNQSQLKRRLAVLLDDRFYALRNCSLRWRYGCRLTLLAVACGLSSFSFTQNSAALADEANPVGRDSVDQDARESQHKREPSDNAARILHAIADSGVIWRLDRRRLDQQPWVPEGLVLYSAYRFDPQSIVATASRSFDEWAGYERALADVLEGLEKDPYGPGVDVEHDLLDYLSGDVSVLV
ncbi:MAG: M56 family metallopeptidase, partial [Planctomycetota bacterium]